MASLVFLLLLSLCLLTKNGAADLNLNVADFGAIGDGKTDASRSFLSAWALACASRFPATIFVPPKTYLLRPTVFEGPCINRAVTIELNGILLAPADYNDMGSSISWLKFHRAEGLSIVGGYINGQGSTLWACKKGGHHCPTGARSLQFVNSRNVVVTNLTSINSKFYHIVIDDCDSVTLQGVRIIAPENSPNTDGIHIHQSTNVRVLNAGIKTGDDCISIGPGSKNVWVQRVACGPGHGISIGSLGQSEEEDGVQNVTAKHVVFNGTMNGFRIKTWARPSKGFVNGVLFQTAVMSNVRNPIIIDQSFCDGSGGCPNQNSGIKISGLTYKSIKGTSATEIAMKFNCSASSPCKGIKLQDIKLTYLSSQPALSFCKNAQGTAVGSVIPASCF
ncbi:polygalacturonase-like [Aristolochia californica]|uniref:polygalacturonase-like n=1 Tax=Aristolochia californica TaxID=171875 RepID=UPI0035E1A01B